MTRRNDREWRTVRIDAEVIGPLDNLVKTVKDELGMVFRNKSDAIAEALKEFLKEHEAKEMSGLRDFPWSDLTSDEFEELCRELHRLEGYENVRRVSGLGSGDLGRDIHAEEWIRRLNGSILTQKIFIQCRNYAGSRTTISPYDIDKCVYRAQNLDYPRARIVTSHDLSSPAKSYAERISEDPSKKIQIDWWNKYLLNRILSNHPQIIPLYFGTKYEISNGRVVYHFVGSYPFCFDKPLTSL